MGMESERRPMQLLTVKEAAARLSVKASTVYAMVASGELACHRLRTRPGARGAIRVSEAQLAAFLAASATGADAGRPGPGPFTHSRP